MLISAHAVQLQLENKGILEKAFKAFPVSSMISSYISLLISPTELSPSIGGTLSWSCYR